MINKQLILVSILFFTVLFTACGQSISGRYTTDDEDSVIQSLEFSGSTVRIVMEFMGYKQTMSASYKREGKTIIISSSQGDMELEIIDGNTIIGCTIPIDDIEFKKK